MATLTLRPSAAGDLSGLYVFPADGIHWNKVDEATPDEDTTYVHRYGGGTGTDEDNYTLDNLAGAAAIANVQVAARVRKIAQFTGLAGTTLIGLGVRIGGVSYYANSATSNESYFYLTRNYALNPDTGVAWVQADINSLQSCLRLAFTNLAGAMGGLTSARCTQLYIVVTYTPAIAVPTVQTDPATEVS